MATTTGSTSLQGKITNAYRALVVSTAVLGIIAFSDLLFLERQVMQEEVVSDLKDAVLEMRREEKNLFLYGDKEALERAAQESERSQRILQQHHNTLKHMWPSTTSEETLKHLKHYRERLQKWPQTATDDPVALQAQIRLLGHRIHLTIEDLDKQQRLLLERAVSKSQWILILFLGLIGLSISIVGQLLKRAVVTPLKQLESRLMPIAKGRFNQLQPPSRDREFVAFTDGFNRMLRELEIRKRRMLQSEKLASVGILSAGVAHELNNPLSNISTSCQLLLEELREAPPEQLENWLRQIDNETERGRHIVRTLLEFGCQRVFEKQPLKLFELIDETRLIIGKTLAQASVRLSLNIPEELRIRADKQRLQQLFINLIQNALNAGGDEELELRISAMLCDRGVAKIPQDAEVAGSLQCLNQDEERFVEILVSDNGPGIPSEHLSRIFDPFFTTSEPGQGVGLGLFIAQEIVREHDGCLAIASRPGRGTQVIVLLPTGASDDE
jgi:signal transduction histidine kinase